MRRLLALLVLFPAACQQRPAENASAPQAMAVIPLFVTTAGGTHRFDVEPALTPEQQAKGLSLRTTLPADRGMLFPFQPPRPPSFWMKDYKIPIDALMIAPSGRIAAIFPDRKPDSLEPASSGDPMIAVVEIAGGRAKALGIKEGDLVRWGQCPGTATRPGESWDRLSFCPAA